MVKKEIIFKDLEHFDAIVRFLRDKKRRMEEEDNENRYLLIYQKSKEENGFVLGFKCFFPFSLREFLSQKKIIIQVAVKGDLVHAYLITFF